MKFKKQVAKTIVLSLLLISLSPSVLFAEDRRNYNGDNSPLSITETTGVTGANNPISIEENDITDQMILELEKKFAEEDSQGTNNSTQTSANSNNTITK